MQSHKIGEYKWADRIRGEQCTVPSIRNLVGVASYVSPPF